MKEDAEGIELDKLAEGGKGGFGSLRWESRICLDSMRDLKFPTKCGDAPKQPLLQPFYAVF